MKTRSQHGIHKPKALTATSSASDDSKDLHLVVPASAKIAIAIPVWRCAMNDEFLALLRNKTWFLTFLPPGKNLIGCTWVFRLKKNADGSVARHKARLVAQGFSQEAGFDFNETFSPVVKPNTIRLMLSIAVSSNWSIKHLDVNNAFLNGDLEEEIYMRQPPGFEQGAPGMVCKLNKALYGLKQASRAWFITIQAALLKLGFTQSKADTSLFYLNSKAETIYLLLYVDDMLITGNSSSGIRRVIDQLHNQFALKDLGDVTQFLGIEVTKTSQGLHPSQSAYIKEILKKVKMIDAKPFPTPMVSDLKLSKSEGEPTIDGKLYRSVVGALQYATITRPELSYSVNKVSQFMSCPLDIHWKAVKRILRYLAGSTDHGIHIKASSFALSGFSDSDWASDIDDRRSTSGYCVYFGDNLISWCAKKQKVVSRSSTEAEYRSLALLVSEVTWLQSLLAELGWASRVPPVLWVDNLSTIALASNPVLHSRTKHIELDLHFVRDKVASNLIDLRHVPTLDQAADILTKPLSNQFFSRLRNKLGVCSLASLELRGGVNLCRIIDNVENENLSNVHTEDVHVERILDKTLTSAQEDPCHVSSPSWKDILLKGREQSNESTLPCS